MNPKNIRLCEGGKIIVLVHVISLDVRWHEILHGSLHVLRETCDT